MTIAGRIRQLRTKYNLNITEASIQFNMDKSTWSRIESGKAKPSLQLVETICQEWHVNADYLLFGEKESENLLDLSGLTLSQIHSIKVIVEGLRRS